MTLALAAAAGSGAVTLLISHRFSTVRMADLILVVAGGRIAERGDLSEDFSTKTSLDVQVKEGVDVHVAVKGRGHATTSTSRSTSSEAPPGR